jgi:xylulose-5-phosphate/fructose-6-phosphate phosphoketolase
MFPLWRRSRPSTCCVGTFDMIFTADKPVIFAYHGYPWLIHRLTYRRTDPSRIHVRGYKEEGTTTTPFDMVMLNDLDRYHLVIDVIDRVPSLQSTCATLRQQMADKRLAAREYTREHGDDIPEVRDWVWSDARGTNEDAAFDAAAATGGDNE